MIKPIGNTVLIKKIKEDKTTTSGIILTTDKNKLPKGEVIAKGVGLYLQNGDLIEILVNEKDTILYTGRTLADLDDEYSIIDASQILGVY